MTHRAKIETVSASLASDFGRDYAMRVFGLTLAELEAIVGRYTKGKRKGQLRHTLQWQKVVRGGWLATGPSYAPGERTQGCVKRPGERFNHAIINPWKYDDRGGYETLWTTDHKRFGWVPGETREQYHARQKVRSAWLKTRQDRAYDKARAIIARLPDEELARHVAKREHFNRLTNRVFAFVEVLCTAELFARAQAYNAERKAQAELADAP